MARIYRAYTRGDRRGRGDDLPVYTPYYIALPTYAGRQAALTSKNTKKI